MEKPAEIGLNFKTSRISYFSNYFLIVLISVLTFTVYSYLNLGPALLQYIFLAVFLIFLFLALEPEYERTMRQYVITNSEIIKIEGIIVKKRISIPFQSIADVKVIKGVIGRIFNFGTLNVKGVKEEIIMKGMKEPETLVK